MAQSSNVSAGGDATAVQYNNLRADVFGAHHSDALGTLLVNADISPTAAIALSKLAALTINRALVTNGSGVIVVSAVTATELGYLAGIVSKPVCNSGDETIAGVKTFSSIPLLPASDPTSDNQAVRRKFIQDYLVKLTASDNLQKSNDGEVSTGSDVYVLIKEIQVFRPGTVRAKWDMRTTGGGGSQYVYGKIYVDGVAVGTEHSQQGDTYNTYTQSSVGIAAGSRVQLWGKINLTTGWYRNFRIYYDKAFETD
jgi:hypothetical protein